jgi:hypothetical protein
MPKIWRIFKKIMQKKRLVRKGHRLVFVLLLQKIPVKYPLGDFKKERWQKKVPPSGYVCERVRRVREKLVSLGST